MYGDRCLKVIGQILTENASGDLYIPGRYAGDEFIVITIEKKEKAGIWARETVEKIADITREHGVPVTAAAGVAGGCREGARTGSHFSATVDDLINLASLASTLSKRNCEPVTFSR